MAFDETGHWIMTPQAAMDAWRTGVNTDISLGQTAQGSGVSQLNPGSSALSSSQSSGTISSANPFASNTTPATASDTTSQPNPLDPSTWKLPNLSDVFKGMQNGPGGAASGVEAWADAAITKVLIFSLAAILIAAGLFLLAKETNVGQSTIREMRNSIPKK